MLFVQTVELLLHKGNSTSEVVEVNGTNSKGLTTMDLLNMVIQTPTDVTLRKLLQCSGAVGVLPNDTKAAAAKLELPLKPSKDWVKLSKFEELRDSPSKARNVLLLVAAWIATVTFQAVSILQLAS